MESMGQCRVGTECGDGKRGILKAGQRFCGLIDVVGPVAARISREHALVQHLRFHRMLSLDHHRRSPESAGSSERSGIDCRTKWLVRHMVSHTLIKGGGSASTGTTRSNCSMIRINFVNSVASKHCR